MEVVVAFCTANPFVGGRITKMSLMIIAGHPSKAALFILLIRQNNLSSHTLNWVQQELTKMYDQMTSSFSPLLQ